MKRKGDWCVFRLSIDLRQRPQIGGEDDTGTDEVEEGSTGRFLESMFVCRSVFRAISAYEEWHRCQSRSDHRSRRERRLCMADRSDTGEGGKSKEGEKAEEVGV